MSDKIDSKNFISKADDNLSFEDSIVVVETFEDSLKIGRKGKNKLTTKLYRSKGGVYGWTFYINIEFFSHQKDNWVLRNQFEFEKDGLSDIDPKLSDFNNDSLLDFNYKAITAARGANNVRRLFIYSVQGDSLIVIKNSPMYPNMVYNEELDCIDAQLFHGCSSQVFLKIEGDSLRELAWINFDYPNGYSVTEIDELGNEKEIERDTSNQYGCVTRFVNYNPLIEYTEYPYE